MGSKGARYDETIRVMVDLANDGSHQCLVGALLSPTMKWVIGLSITIAPFTAKARSSLPAYSIAVSPEPMMAMLLSFAVSLSCRSKSQGKPISLI